MQDFSEFRQHWRPLLAAFLGLGSGLSLNTYILSVFAPYLIGEFDWTRSQWALLGVAQIVVMLCMPIAGRLTDMFGVKPVATVGAISFPLFLVAIATMQGNIHVYLAIYVAQTIICSTTTSTVYSRLVATAYSKRRGLALGLFGISPPLISAAGAPAITAFVDSHGWRAGYLAVALFCATCSIVTLLLIPGRSEAEKAPVSPVRKQPFGVYPTLFMMPAFWLIFSAFFLVNLPFSLAVSQLKLVVLDQGLGDSTAALLVSAFALGSIAGRIVSGIALDYLPCRIIAAVCFVMPGIGLLMLASPYDSTPMVTAGILLIGIAFGGEGDILPYIITRYFSSEHFSTVLGLMTAALGGAMAIGNGILSISLDKTGGFNAYMLIAALATMIGSSLFLALERGQRVTRREITAAGHN